MEWLSFTDAVPLSHGLDCPVQFVAVMADIPRLNKEIPIPPRLVLPSEGPASPVNCWYGRIGNRLLAIECEAQAALHEMDEIGIYTPFVDSRHTLGDWAILLELRELPSSVLLTRPVYIESRTSHSMYAVYRPNPKGWDDAIYRTGTSGEAESLLRYMKDDRWNDSCFIGATEPQAKWSISQTTDGKVQLLGTYPEKALALSVACRMSLDLPDSVLTVADLTKRSAETFSVCAGLAIPKRVETDEG